MKNEKMERQSRVLWIVTCILLLISTVVIYVTHRTVPFMMDDLWYSTKLCSDTPITSFRDIIDSQIWHYHNWGGRSLTHGMLQLTLLAGERAADVLNVAVTMLLAVLMCVVAGERKQFGLFTALSVMLGLNANWKMSMFWQAGAANYLYITCFILAFLWCYLREQEKQLPGITLWIVPLGVIAGWSNENMGPSVWVISLIVILLAVREKKRVKPWMILGNLSCLFGSVMVIAAPGNFVRSKQVASNEYGALWNLFLRCYAESKAALEYLFPALLLLFCLLVISKGVLKLAVGRKNLLLLLCTLLSWGAMVLSPHYPDRATFGTQILLCCVIMSLIKDILREKPELQGALWCVVSLVWLRGMFFMGEFLAIMWGWIK